MSQALHQSIAKSRLSNSISKKVGDLFNKINGVLWFCLIPEDSTETAPAKHLPIKNPDGFNILGVIKTGFWIVMTLILAVLIGQLN